MAERTQSHFLSDAFPAVVTYDRILRSRPNDKGEGWMCFEFIIARRRVARLKQRAEFETTHQSF